ncbi:MAG: hypothetical protein COB09_17065 [Thalassobium sp.]|nr:MAG: hypothetical protein COB09_17065 [Thalassobium sp.]
MEDVEMTLDGEFYGNTEVPTEIINEMMSKPQQFKITTHEDKGPQTHNATISKGKSGYILIMQRVH